MNWYDAPSYSIAYWQGRLRTARAMQQGESTARFGRMQEAHALQAIANLSSWAERDENNAREIA